MNFSAIIDKWKELVLPTHKPSSQASEKTHLDRIDLSFGKTDVEKINLESIQRWVVGLSDSPGYVRNLVGTMRLVWEMAQAWSYVAEDKRSPFEKLRLPKRQRHEQPYFTEEQSRRLISLADEPLKTMLWVLAESGARIGEIAGLQTDDIDLVNKTIRIRRTAWRGRMNSPKSAAGVRKVDISDQLAEHLKKSFRNSILLFPDAHNQPYNCSNLLTRQLKPLLARAGISGGFKAFRHGSASIMADWGINERARQDRLGHSNFDTSKIYTHSSRQYHRELANRLGKVFEPSLSSGTVRHD